MEILNNFPFYHPIKTIFLFVVLTIGLGYGISQLETRNSFDGELPQSDPINIDIEKVKEVYGDRSLVMFGYEAESIYTEEVLQDLKSLSDSIKEIKYVLKDEIKSLASVENISKKSWGVESTGFIDAIPETTEAWNALKKDIASNEMVNGTLVSHDGRLATIIAPLEDGFDGPGVYGALKQLRDNFDGEGKLHITGAPILVEDVQQGISKDSKRFISIAILLVFFGFFVCFRSLPGVLLPLVMVLTSIVWTMGTMGYLGLDITVVSNALPVIMIAVASSYAIHFMSAYFDLSSRFDDKLDLVRGTLKKIAVPIAITGMTSALGSLSLLVFKVESLKEFGIIGCIGFAYATIICLGLMPALCMMIKKPKKRDSKKSIIKSFTSSLTRRVLQHQNGVIATYLILIPSCIWLASQVQIGDDYMKFFPKSHDGRIAAEIFNEKLDGVRVMDVMIDTKEVGGIKQVDFYKELRQLGKDIESMSAVGAVNSYIDMVEHISDNFDNDESQEIQDSEQIAQYLMLHEMSATPGEVSTFYDEHYQTARLQVLLKSSNPEDHVNLHAAIDYKATEVLNRNVQVNFGGDVMHRIALGQYIVKGKIQNILLALLIVFLTTWFIFRSYRKGLFTLIPIVISLVMVFGFMGLTGIRLGISTSLLTAMIVGIGIDFSIHYLVSFYNHVDEGIETALLHTSDSTSKAITYDALSNILGFCVLSFSGFLPVQHFGWLLAFSMLLIFVNTLVVFPLLFKMLGKSKLHLEAKRQQLDWVLKPTT